MFLSDRRQNEAELRSDAGIAVSPGSRGTNRPLKDKDMERTHYHPLRQARLKPGATYYTPQANIDTQVDLDSPAIEVMTDFRRVGAVTVETDASIGTAEQLMKTHRIRSLIVVDPQRRVQGLVTATDILGEKPLKLTYERGLRHDEISVRHIMTPADKLDVIEIAHVLVAEVGNVLETLKRSERQHALVVEEASDGRNFIRGIFSAAQIARQLGISFETVAASRSFAEIEAAISAVSH
jgi:CBS domain-containing protein